MSNPARRARFLIVCFGGWALVRLATDVDPTDEPRGSSGWTFAFGTEPDLDRIVRFQPEEHPELVRPGERRRWGVRVTQCFGAAADGSRLRLGAAGGKVRLLGEPRLEGRNRILTQPGAEPIIPFDLEIELGRSRIRRGAPLPHPTYKLTPEQLASHAPAGATPEPITSGLATGIWDPHAMLTARRARLQGWLASSRDDEARARLSGRIAELTIAIDGKPNGKSDVRLFAHHMVERFSFKLDGPRALVPGAGPLSQLDPRAPWPLSFVMTGFDADLLAMFVQGCLQVPFLAAGRPSSQR